jgi:hypothetical protein
MSNLFAFGCSHTYGYGLPDVVQYMTGKEIYPTKFGKNYNFGSKFAWPQLLANKLNLECYNYGCCGANGKEVVWLITQCLQHNMIFNKDTVAILWPAFSRTGIFENDPLCNPSSQVITNRIWADKGNKRSKVFYYSYYNEYDFAIQRWQEIILVDLLCKERGINCYHSTYNKELTPAEVGLKSITKNMNIDFMQGSPWSVDFSADGKHHGPKSNELLASKWFNFIKGISK